MRQQARGWSLGKEQKAQIRIHRGCSELHVAVVARGQGLLHSPRSSRWVRKRRPPAITSRSLELPRPHKILLRQCSQKALRGCLVI